MNTVMAEQQPSDSQSCGAGGADEHMDKLGSLATNKTTT